jgi:hypothetical protein
MGQAAQLFNGNREQTLIKRITPTAEQREFLQEQWNALAEHLKQKLSNRGYPITTWLQGSYKYGTLIKPMSPSDEYDVDVGVYFNWTDNEDVTPTPAQLRDWAQQELLNYKTINSEIKRVEQPAKERCSRAIYTRQFHIDTPIYHLNPDADQRRLACLSDKWEDSDPKTIYKWFKDAVGGDDRDQLRRLVRYLKGWAAVSFSGAPESRPSSILLTVLTTEAYQNLFRLFGLDDDDALVAIIKTIHTRLLDDRVVPNPIDPNENLNRISEAGWEGFLPRLQALRDVAELAEDAPDEVAAALAWSEAFSFLMPLPETDQVEIIDEASGHAVMVLPDIEIQVFGGDPKGLIATYRNEVPSVAKDCKLVFRIANPHLVPEYATIEWTVRNEGDEADQHSDLGHRCVGLRLLTTDEHTAYIGRHFMDCIVRLNGRVYSVRRVPVNIRNLQYPQRNPPRPSYTKLRSPSRRR